MAKDESDEPPYKLSEEERNRIRAALRSELAVAYPDRIIRNPALARRVVRQSRRTGRPPGD